MEVLDQFQLDGSVGLVTGAASGIGQAYARGLIEAGARVACLDVAEDPLRETVEEWGEDALAVKADVTDPAAVKKAIRKTHDHFGSVDLVYPNAGTGKPLMPFYERTLEDWKDVVELNLTGVFVTAKAAANHMIEHGIEGRIISTASIYGFVGTFDGTSPAYSASKAGVVNLTREMATALAPHGIRANAIAPSFVDTELLRQNLRELGEEGKEQFEEFMENQTLLGMISDPDDLKGAAVFLASEASRYMTGVTLPVDSGYLAR